MREIKFRGKSKKDNKWLYGNLGDARIKLLNTEYSEKVIFDNVWSFNSDNCAFIVKDLAVYPHTIGQFTGLKDRNGKEIYEGDIVSIITDCAAFIYKIVFDEGWFCLADKDNNVWDDMIGKEIKVIGNIYDNSELLKEMK